MREPFDAGGARKRLNACLYGGTVRWTDHCKDEQRKDTLTDYQLFRALKNGRMHMQAELENGAWRYRFESSDVTVVVEFESDTEVCVVTCWRNKR